MGLQKLLPRSIRVASCYVKCTKTKANKQLSREQKLNAILKIENAWLGDLTKLFKGEGIQDGAIAVGMKDMAAIYTSLNAPDDAIRFLNEALGHFPRIVAERPTDQTMFISYMLAIYYKGKAYSQKGMVEACEKEYDDVNLKLNTAIANDPSNSRLQELYGYLNKQIFYDYIAIADNFQDRKQNAYRTCFNQLKTFEQRDPGNSQLLDYIDRFN